jgi:chondroitin-sulfate-ABC endolyase/exolyase
LALAGSPDGTEPVDTELARAYLRLSQHDKPDQFTRIFLEKGITPEENPSGNWPMNYAALAIHRRNDWLVTARGHSRYLWAAEAYIGANYYGRYITYGHLQILGSGDPVTNAASGFQMEGWNWNRWPGTTTIHLPVDQLKAQIIKPCPRSGFEEMLLSDEAFAGAIHLDNRQGAFAMKLHEHDKYNGSHRARKSVFFFDNRIICLGSDIENSVEEYPTETTLFQCHLTNTKDPLLLNGKPMEEFPLTTTINNQQWNWISDIHNNYYFVSPGNSFILLKQHQESRHQATGEPAFGDFASAVITHGNAPKDESYEYAILVKSNPEEAARFDQSLKSSNPPYEVHQKDKNAHIVWDKETNTTAFMLFEPGNQFRSEKLLSVSAPCMVMIRENEQHLHLSICDPDLHLYDGPADDLIVDGKRQERGVYSRYWYYNPAAKANVSIILNGNWKLPGETENCQTTRLSDGNTQLTFTLQHGVTNQIELLKRD